MSLRAEDGPVSPAGSPQPAVHSRAGASAQGTLSQAEGRVRGGWPRAPPAFWGCTCPGPRPGAWAVTSTHSGGWQRSGTFRPRGASSRALGDGRGPGPLPSPFPIPARLRPARPQTLHASGFRPPAPPCGGCGTAPRPSRPGSALTCPQPVTHAQHGLTPGLQPPQPPGSSRQCPQKREWHLDPWCRGGLCSPGRPLGRPQALSPETRTGDLPPLPKDPPRPHLRLLSRHHLPCSPPHLTEETPHPARSQVLVSPPDAARTCWDSRLLGHPTHRDTPLL